MRYELLYEALKYMSVNSAGKGGKRESLWAMSFRSERYAYDTIVTTSVQNAKKWLKMPNELKIF